MADAVGAADSAFRVRTADTGANTHAGTDAGTDPGRDSGTHAHTHTHTDAHADTAPCLQLGYPAVAGLGLGSPGTDTGADPGSARGG